MRPFALIGKRIQREFWNEFKVKFSEEKAAFNRWETELWETAVGVEIRARENRCVLPAVKVKKFVDGIDAMKLAADAHPRRLVQRELVEQAMGRAVHSCDAVPDVWIVLIALIALITMQHRFEKYIMFNAQIVALFDNMVDCLLHHNGRPLVPYHYRPGDDGLRVVETWTDASRRTSTFFGAAGGYFYMRGTNTVFYFAWRWPVSDVKTANIGELEMAAATIAGLLVEDVVRHLLQDEQKYYMYQFGDNEGVFKHALNSFHSRKPGLRQLTFERAKLERRCNRLLQSCHVRRTQNQKADSLANLAVADFIRDATLSFPGAHLQQLIVPPDYASLSRLIQFKQLAVSDQ